MLPSFSARHTFQETTEKREATRHRRTLEVRRDASSNIRKSNRKYYFTIFFYI